MREWIQECDRCQEVTPHSLRGTSPTRVLAWIGIAVMAALVWASLVGFPPALFVSVPALGLPIALLLHENAKHEHDIACERCRSQRVAEHRAWRRRKGPTLDGRTIWR